LVISNRNEFKEYCLRRLGKPVTKINVDDFQVEDRIEDALQYYYDYHYDATNLYYWKHALTAQDISQQYLDVAEGITGIKRIFPLYDSQVVQSSLFDMRYQLRLHDLFDFTSTSYVNYTLTMQHLRTLEMLFTGEVPIRYARHEKKLYIDWSWGTGPAIEGTIIIAEGTIKLDPDTNPDIWNDRWLKRYATALIKRQWGENIKKFKNVPLPGGIVLNGDEIYDSAAIEIEKLESEMIRDYSIPPEFIIG